MLLEGGLVFRGVDDDLAGEAVAEGVQRRLFLAFLGARASRELGVGAVGGEPGLGHSRDLLSGNKRGLVRREGSNGKAGGKGREEAKWLKGRKMPGWGEE